MAYTTASGSRTYVGSLLDRLLSHQFDLPGERSTYEIKALRIPLDRDGLRIELAADLYRPVLPGEIQPDGTILVRSPYGRGLPTSAFLARIYASRSYQILFVSCSGTFGSGGHFDPFRNEVEEGKAVVAWMREQDWYTGSFAALGASYMGFNTWALLVDPPHDLVAAIVAVGPHDFHRVLWGTGAMNMDYVEWAGTIAHQEEPCHMLSMLLRPNRFRHILDGIPLAQAAAEAYKGQVPWLQNMITISDPSNDYYLPMKLQRGIENAEIPIMLLSGWYDIFQDQTFEQYFRLRARGCNVAFTVGNWNHAFSSLAPETNQQTLLWLDEHLAKGCIPSRPAPMQYYVTGVEEWRYAADFPPSGDSNTFYLKGDGSLSCDMKSIGVESSSFVFDPRDPTPTMGGNILALSAGKVDDTALAARSDTLTFETQSLTEFVEMIGRPVVELNHSTDIPFADVFIRISEVNEKGKSFNISEGYQRLDPERTSELIKIPLSWCAHRFLKGKRIRLLLAGGSHPHFARNLGTDNIDNTGKNMRPVTHTIFHGPQKCSKLTFT